MNRRPGEVDLGCRFSLVVLPFPAKEEMKVVALTIFALLIASSVGQNCGCDDADDGKCCSRWGYCGRTADYCDKSRGCQSGCWGDDGGNTQTEVPAPPTTSSIPPTHSSIPSPTHSNHSKDGVSIANDYGFLGFTYAACGNANEDFAKMKQWGARHVRMYDWCDRQNWMSEVLDAAGAHGLGVIPMIWYGYEESCIKDARRKEGIIVNTIKSHRYGKNVVSVSVGNELLFDNAIGESELIQTIQRVKSALSAFNIPVGTSEMPYKMTNNVASHEDLLMANILPYFANDATDGGNAWRDMSYDIDKKQTKGKFMITETYWAWKLNDWRPHSADAVTSIKSMQNFWNMLSNHCEDWRKWNAGYFAYCFNDNCMDGLGISDGNKLRIQWNPKTSC
ncbi:hypothetical protein PROFUN_09080 [Planoprotostelium fungivorum]|uniref:glucan endo-1,3-beta-D-glucosidase n=1 Tax=Planoprotostelium fungivorum TaxID=1890364 RepID=A0A2P6NIG1_9EUKA|nr:hypothetical protein PROFUN_09080 [Planoprotostelium fungivorum]